MLKTVTQDVINSAIRDLRYDDSDLDGYDNRSRATHFALGVAGGQSDIDFERTAHFDDADLICIEENDFDPYQFLGDACPA